MRQKPIVNFSSFGLVPFMLSGLSSGLTPCRFAVIVFFVIALLLIKGGVKPARFVGGCFVAAVFVTTFFLYWGAFERLRNLELFDIVTKSAYLFMAGLSLILGAMHMLDWWRYRLTQDEGKLILKIPAVLKEVLGGLPSKGVNCWVGYGLPAILCGFIVGIIQSHCLGRNYLSTMASMLSADGKEIRAALYILLYDVLSIAPLFLVYLFFSKIIKSKEAAKCIQENIPKYKIVLSAVCLGLGLGLLYMFV